MGRLVVDSAVAELFSDLFLQENRNKNMVVTSTRLSFFMGSKNERQFNKTPFKYEKAIVNYELFNIKIHTLNE
ncbi:hypothetical protein CHRYSEO8AT_560089 [Chryseobacterium sp. 8AT]|nr:hypothetical protein CHRYSEO8AT_560089 [Chryseobacterium sp. 8AT]